MTPHCCLADGDAVPALPTQRRTPTGRGSASLEKGLVILSLFDRRHPYWRVSEISKATGIHRTSVCRYVNTLVALGFLARRAESKLLHLSAATLMMGHSFLDGCELRNRVKPVVDLMYREYHTPITTALVHQVDLVPLYRQEGSAADGHLPTWRTDGLSLRVLETTVLAHMRPHHRKAYLAASGSRRRTAGRRLSADALLPELARVEARGYAIDNQAATTGIIRIGAPVWDHRLDAVTAAVGLECDPAPHSDTQVDAQYIGVLLRLADELSTLLTNVGT
ncbi:MAG: helix-turn-helix domain-containing protein [Desulfosarcinaceae bacterium]|nr:helix-turn-helix domain-containing protein [Desulfosarcinaceae bacterium]